MADEVDLAQEFMELGLADAIRRASTPIFTAKGTGSCLFCKEPVGDGVRWCGVECRDGYQKLTGLK